MDWLRAAATGRDARRDALPGQHLADCVPVIPLIPNRRSSRRQVFSTPSAPVKSLHCPLTQVEPSGTTFAVADPMERAGHAPLVEAGHRGVGFEGSGISHQDIWLCGVGWLCGIRC